MRISGKVIDAETGETLPGASVYVSDAEGTPGSASYGSATDGNGNFSFAGDGRYLTASFTGYAKKTTSIAGKSVFLFELDPQAITLPEVNIIASKSGGDSAKKANWKMIAIVAGVVTVAGTLLYSLFRPIR